MDSIGASGTVGNINWLRFTSGVAIVRGTTNTMTLSGFIHDSTGTGIPGAGLDFLYLPSPSARSYSYVRATTDSTGHYSVTFDAVPDAIDGGVAFASVGKAGYEIHYHYIFVDTTTAEFDLTMLPIVQISAGQTIEVTVTANNSICVNNFQDSHPWPLAYEWVCQAVQVIPATSGTATIELLPNSGTNSGVQLEVETDNIVKGFDLTQTVPVQAGQLVGVAVEIPYGSSDRTFTLVTSIAENTGPLMQYL
jgi:hypothetical protein